MITFNEFLERAKTEDIAIHTANEKQAATLLSELDKKGYTWPNGVRLIYATGYDLDREKTCYEVHDYGDIQRDITHASIRDFQQVNSEIIEFADIDFSEKTN